jgi:hypothetical protein
LSSIRHASAQFTPIGVAATICGLPTGRYFSLPMELTLLLVPTILGSKLAGWIAFIIALLLTYFILWTRASHRNMPFLLRMSTIALFSFFHEYSYAFWNRPRNRFSSFSALLRSLPAKRFQDRQL